MIRRICDICKNPECVAQGKHRVRPEPHEGFVELELRGMTYGDDELDLCRQCLRDLLAQALLTMDRDDAESDIPF